MSRKRIFTVHVNIDDMTAIISGLDGQEEKADWIDGYMVGVHGHLSRETWSHAKRSGYSFGSAHFAEAEEFRAAQTAKSALAVEARRSKSRKVPTGYPLVHPMIHPIQQSNNLTIQATNKRANQKPIDPFLCRQLLTS